MTTILEGQHITKRFGQLAAVDDLSFKVEEGEIFGIAGPNGAGKTTLFNVLSGVYSGSGEIVFDGHQINRLRPYQICRRGLARTFQITTVFSTLTVYENVKVGAYFGNTAANTEETIKQALAFVGLKGRENTVAGRLRLFEKKLTMVAAALATGPRLLMLDEPVGGLSPAEIEQSMALFRRINSELGITLIVIEHLMKVLMGISQRMMIIHNGRKIRTGTPEEVANDKQVIEVYLGAEYA